ncbi:hypothetical protein PO909_002862 [Leuciscus waleckii]
MLDKKAADAIKTVPLSNDTVCCRIDDMSADITKLCDGANSEHQQLLLHTDIRWLSKRKTLQRLFELRDQVSDFLSEHLHSHAPLLKNNSWLAYLAYLADVFSRLNDLNLELQGKDTTVLHLYDRVSGFMKKIELWCRKCQNGDVSSFPQLDMCLVNVRDEKVSILQTVQAHLDKLSSEFRSYFPDIEVHNSALDWIRNPFVATCTQTVPVTLQERLIDLSSDRGLKIMFSETSLTQFWCNAEKEYPDVGEHALYELLPFGSTYLCEVTFSAMAHIKTKQRNRLSLERNLIAAVATLHLR